MWWVDGYLVIRFGYVVVCSSYVVIVEGYVVIELSYVVDAKLNVKGSHFLIWLPFFSAVFCIW